MSSAEIGELVGESFVVLLALSWWLYVPAYIRNRIRTGKEPVEKEAQLIKTNRLLALVIFAAGFVDALKVVADHLTTQ